MKKRAPAQRPLSSPSGGWRRLRWRWALLVGGAVALAGIVWGVMRAREQEALCTENRAYLDEAIRAGDFYRARSDLATARGSCGPEHGADLDALGENIKRGIADIEAAERSTRNEAEKRANDAAARVWASYDQLPDRARMKEKLFEAVKEARTHEERLADAPARARLARHNGAMARFRMALLINPEARAKGDRGEVLVPSADRAKCLVWGSQWSQDAESLRSLGFEKIRCEEHTFTSSLTGEKVTEPAQEWALR